MKTVQLVKQIRVIKCAVNAAVVAPTNLNNVSTGLFNVISNCKEEDCVCMKHLLVSGEKRLKEESKVRITPS